MTVSGFTVYQRLAARLPGLGSGVAFDAGLMTAAVMANRITRVGTAVALAWALGGAEFGIAMIAMTTSNSIIVKARRIFLPSP